MLDDLHAPLLPILRHLLAQAPLPRRGLLLDLACGTGAKAPLLAEALGSGVRLLGVDLDAAAAGVVRNQAPGTNDKRRCDASSVNPGRWSLVCGDAHALPLRDGCVDGAVCIAALGMFRNRLAALGELRRALRPGAPALLVTAEQRWAQVVRWPPEIAAQLIALGPAIPTSPDIGGELAVLLAAAGFRAARARGFLLEESPHPALLELPLAPWPALRPLAAAHLGGRELAHCDALWDGADIELAAVALAAVALA